MAHILKGAPVAQAMTECFRQEAEILKEQGVQPTLAIVRVGERADDLSYERGAMKRAASMGIDVKQIILPEDVDSDTFFGELRRVNQDADVHGILLFRPLPRHLDGERARQMIDPAKDVDGCTDGSLAGVFTNTDLGFSPCTAQAAMEILHFYGVDVKGKRAAVIGRSLVIGRPVAMMLMHENATVTVCHTRNEEKQKLCGDVKFDEAETIVDSITPVPGGVGSVTTAVLCSHVIEAAKKMYQQNAR